MASSKAELDAHEQPSPELRAEWKSISRLTPADLEHYTAIDDPRAATLDSGFHHAEPIEREQLRSAFASLNPRLAELASGDSPVIYHSLLPGMLSYSRTSGSD